MSTSPQTQVTDFSRDVLGRYICNGLDEALQSTAWRPFDLIVIGGGSFGSALAQHLFARDQGRVHRILVLEAGPLSLPEHVQTRTIRAAPSSVEAARSEASVRPIPARTAPSASASRKRNA